LNQPIRAERHNPPLRRYLFSRRASGRFFRLSRHRDQPPADATISTFVDRPGYRGRTVSVATQHLSRPETDPVTIGIVSTNT
jgi:hypothetical protein